MKTLLAIRDWLRFMAIAHIAYRRSHTHPYYICESRYGAVDIVLFTARNREAWIVSKFAADLMQQYGGELKPIN